MAMLDAYVAGIEAIPGLKMHAKPDLTIINFDSDEVDIFRVAELRPSATGFQVCRNKLVAHAMMSMLQAPARQPYLRDLSDAVGAVRDKSGRTAEIAAQY